MVGILVVIAIIYFFYYRAHHPKRPPSPPHVPTYTTYWYDLARDQARFADYLLANADMYYLSAQDRIYLQGLQNRFYGEDNAHQYQTGKS